MNARDPLGAAAQPPRPGLRQTRDMTVTLRPMPVERIPAWLEASQVAYAADRERAGEPAQLARRTAERSMATYFPDGEPLAGHLLFEALVDDEPVGVLWLGPHPQRPDGLSWWVYDVEIAPQHRRRGYGAATMRAAEVEVRARGGRELALNVFGFNTGAIALYEELGFAVTSQHMAKRV